MEFDKAECLNWGFGNLLENTVRGTVAEFVVAKALGLTTDPRVEWDSVDLRYQGISIEIKSSAYLQSWKQEKPSDIRFDIKPRKQTWSPEVNDWTMLNTPQRIADLYVFCLFREQNVRKANPLNTSQWNFFVIPTPILNKTFGNQGTVGLNPIRGLAQPISYEGLRAAIKP